MLPAITESASAAPNYAVHCSEPPKRQSLPEPGRHKGPQSSIRQLAIVCLSPRQDGAPNMAGVPATKCAAFRVARADNLKMSRGACSGAKIGPEGMHRTE